ncbi:hypothetical protein [Algibacter sp. 2305UL17-15]|uniref:hypothetical protein n=1 Tax=Algibacter sp. 2305UL17-15 TaxID=3231268 RepID=UPI0034599369
MNVPANNNSLNNYSGTITNTNWTTVGTPDVITPGVNGWQGNCTNVDGLHCNEVNAIDILRHDLSSDISGENYAITRGYIDHDETIQARNNNVLGAIESEGISLSVRLEPNQKYYLRFSQVNARRQRYDQFISSAKWIVTLDGNEIGSSIYMPTAKYSEGNLSWHQSIIVFETGDTEDYILEFIVEELHQSADHIHDFKLPISNTGFNTDYSLASIYNYMLLDNISLIQEGHCTAPPGVTEKNNSSFIPDKEQTYVISGWVKEDYLPQRISYSSNISVSFNEAENTSTPFYFYPSGSVIEGWQRIEGSFTVPTNATDINIVLTNDIQSFGYNAFFDDIRIHRSDGNMKSFVYDPATQRLMAELDENNYATLYEYDNEGGLVRVKKETERGIYTIQETRSGNSKINVTTTNN